MIFKSVLFLAHLILLDLLAGKCDTYIRGAVWIHDIAGDEVGYYEGCKKGCFANDTFNENGVRKCEKCSAIKDQQFCEESCGQTNSSLSTGQVLRSRQCKWTKSGKCTSTSCPDMVKNLNKRNGRLLKECLEGTPEEQFYNSISLSVDPPFCANSTPACEKKICDMEFSDYNYTEKLYNESLWPPEHWIGEYIGSPQAEANRWRAAGLQRCLTLYEGEKTDCDDDLDVIYRMPQRTHAATKAARKACQKINGCMYSADNGRCSYWAVWAFVLTLVICVVLVLGIFGAVFFVFKDKILGGAGTILHQS